MKKTFHTFVAQTEDALTTMINCYCKSKHLKEIDRSAPSVCLTFKPGVETEFLTIAVTSTFEDVTGD